MDFLTHRWSALTLAVLMALGAASPSSAQTRALSISTTTQTLDKSLADVARQSGVDILFTLSDVAGLEAPALQNETNALQAVRTLIAGKPLDVVATSSGALIVRPVSKPLTDEHTAADEPLYEVIVTGRLGSAVQKKIEASYSITTLSDTELRTRAINSVGDAMRMIPGVWVDSSAGATIANTRVRGIPRGGFEALAVYEDGLPVQHDPGINWANVDLYLRLDETYSGIEAARGGPSSIFASNAPGGLVNFIPRKGTPELSGIAKFTTADYGQMRGDVWFGGPVADDWRFSVGGFYNQDDGIRNPGKTANEGGQIRALLTKSYDSANVSFGIKYMQDMAFNYAGGPIIKNPDGSIDSLAPFNGRDDTFVNADELDIAIRRPDGTLYPEFDKFNQSSDLQLTMKGDYTFANGTTLKGGIRYRDSDTNRNQGALSSITTAESYLASRRAATLSAFASRGATDVELIYARDQSPLPANANGNGLVALNNLQSIQNPLEETLLFSELDHVFDTGWGRHDTKLGIYGTTANWSHDRNDGIGVIEMKPHARLLDVVAVDTAGEIVGYATEDGIARYQSRYAHSLGGYDAAAAYAADEWQVTDTVRLDAGFRYEKLWIDGKTEGVTSYNLGDPDTLADDTVLSGSGVFSEFQPRFSDHAYTLGANWQFVPDAGVFARYTKSFRLPQIGQYRDNSLPTGVRSQGIDQLEGGFKYQSARVSAYATVFYSEFDDVQFQNYYIDPQTLLVVQETNYGDVETTGLELEADTRLTRYFGLAATVTLQDPKFKHYTYNTIVNGVPVTTSYDDNRPSSMPKVMASVRPSLNLMNGQLRLMAEWQYEGNKYYDDVNSLLLPAFSTFNAIVQYEPTEHLSILVKGNNLTDELGLGQSNGLQSIPGVTQSVIVGRPIFGRSVSGSVMYKF